MGIIISLVVNGLALYAADWLLEGVNFTGNWVAFVVLAAIFALVNTFVKPIIRILTLPITAVTLGLFLIVVNALMISLTAWIAGLFPEIGFTVENFWVALQAGLVTAIAGWVVSLVTDRAAS
jgi:putative membrane protein